MAVLLERMNTLTPEIDGGDYIGDLSHVQTLVFIPLRGRGAGQHMREIVFYPPLQDKLLC